MSRNPTCQAFEALLAEHLQGTLTDPGAAGDLETHLASCPACRAEAKSLERIWAGLGELAEEVPGEGLRNRFYAMLDAYRTGLAKGRRRRGERPWDLFLRWVESCWPRHPAWQMAWTAAALVLGLGLGLVLGGPDAATTEVTALRTEVDSLSRLVGLSLLSQESAADRLRGVSFSQRNADGEILAALLEVLDRDDNANVRLAAIDALAHYTDRAPVAEGLRASLARQRSPLVQLSLVDLLLEINGPESRRAIERLRDDPTLDETVRGHIAHRLSPSEI